MTGDEFNASIRASAAALAEFNLLEATINPTKLQRSERFNKLSLSTKVYSEIYETGLALSHYNIVLKDLAFFQFSYNSSSEWALAYYPNPRLTGSADAIAQYEELLDDRDGGRCSDEDFAALAQEMPIHSFVPRVRFEYSGEQYKPVRHPGAHLHIGMSGEDRWACARKLSPKSFSLIIIRHFYPSNWWPLSRFSLPPEEQSDREAIERCFDRKLVESLQRDGVSQYLTTEDRLGFHLTALEGAIRA